VRRLLQDCLAPSPLPPPLLLPQRGTSTSSSSSLCTSSKGACSPWTQWQPWTPCAPSTRASCCHVSPPAATQLGTLVSRVHCAKVAMTGAVHAHLQLVAGSDAGAGRPQPTARFREAMAHRGGCVLGRWPPQEGRRCYASCLAEVARRRLLGSLHCQGAGARRGPEGG